MSRPAAAELIDERIQFAAAQMRVTPATAVTYLTDEAISGLAQTLAFGFVEETPARYLESAAGLVEDGVIDYDTDPVEAPGLRDALRHDAESLREFANGSR